ncbi:MAG: hydrogenase maturation protease [Roseiflexus sp.]|nr:hydrogenase maturation protease [Roseiflexus sp.]MCS7288438.1 hydrogenase maturation protease [Roseiflexus sp.]MDW8144825.1 hydrogenase maturation protease [Roseiflexaceae bacterium]MDW8232266.1 hydrogenase maturation protease [Roseiflexaceae bacterium]
MPIPHIIIIGYGSDLHGDDAAGRVAAERLAALELPDVQVLSVHQLMPEHAALLAQARTAIFIDADASGCPIMRVTHLAPDATRSAVWHIASPEGLLSLTAAAYGHLPNSWLIHIPILRCDLGAPLSPQAEAGVAEAVDIVRRLIASDK